MRLWAVLHGFLFLYLCDFNESLAHSLILDLSDDLFFVLFVELINYISDERELDLP